MSDTLIPPTASWAELEHHYWIVKQARADLVQEVNAWFASVESPFSADETHKEAVAYDDVCRTLAVQFENDFGGAS